MPTTFQCPKCGAPVSYDKDVIGANLTARCSYCNSSLSVPDEMHPARVISHVNIRMGSPASGGNAVKWILLIVMIPVIGLIIGAVAMGGFLIPLLSKSSTTSSNPVTSRGLRSTPSGGNESTPEFATQLLNFGDEGIGPGMFNDARAIALDGKGKIYVGDYIGGRIQVFDPEGKFITQWMVDKKMPLTGLAADRTGVVYVVQSGVISRHEGETGKLIGTVAYPAGWGFDSVSMSADGGFVASWYKNRDDIVRFNSGGEVVRTIRAAISSITDRSELDTHVAIDGLGNIYALGTFNDAVFKFGPDGKFLTRFGGDGDQPGQFRAPSAIAVDGKGRVYVSDFKGIQIFDENGRFIRLFKPTGTTSEMVFNDKNEIFIAARKHVLKYSFNE
jgi:DNA-directed RNA polymerase subunit RPC12/RpoP